MTRSPRYWARPELRERLMLVAGSRPGYIKHARARFISPVERRASAQMIQHVLSRRKSAPIGLLVDLVRVAEDRDIGRDEAFDLRHNWFEEAR